MLYGYVDYTVEAEPRPFYVGIGDMSRVKSSRRNRQHINASLKFGRKRVVEFETTSSTQLEAWEIGTTAAYHTYIHDPLYNGIGCNLVKGGQRNSGRIDSPEVRQKRGRAISKARKGKPLFSQAQINANTFIRRKGQKLPPRSLEWRNNLSKALAGKKRRGTPRSDATKQKMSIAAMGNTNGQGNRGKTRDSSIRHCKLCGQIGHNSLTCIQRTGSS
jgi:hypothetical protein